MARRKTLTDNQIAKLKPGPKRLAIPDPELTGLYIRVTTRGAKSFAAVARTPHGRQVWTTIGSTDLFSIDEARERAREVIRRIKAGKPAIEPPPVEPDSFKSVAENYLIRHVQKKGLRSGPEIERLLAKYIFPALGDREFIGIRRSDVTGLLDDVEDTSGPREADYCLAVIRQIMFWYAPRVDDYVPPLVRKMSRYDPKASERDRFLDDDEIRTIWKIADDSGTYGAATKIALLTGQRRAKIATMKWADVDVGGVWTVKVEDREKGSGGSLALPELAVEVIRKQKRIGNNPYVFPGRDLGHFTNWSSCKDALDAKAKLEKPWVFHDLRRTCRSLMSRAGVRPDVAERVLGHVKGGVEGTYDRHHYEQEKADALKRLAGLIERLIEAEPAGNVVDLRTAEV